MTDDYADKAAVKIRSMLLTDEDYADRAALMIRSILLDNGVQLPVDEEGRHHLHCLCRSAIRNEVSRTVSRTLWRAGIDLTPDADHPDRIGKYSDSSPAMEEEGEVKDA